mmetsp:Transcript_62388/g.167355  ORF Transcript_62388/g.167355 Transcript_62388/m.167355 type:complete len:162 (-) Transcript_62388:163-648(-)
MEHQNTVDQQFVDLSSFASGMRRNDQGSIGGLSGHGSILSGRSEPSAFGSANISDFRLPSDLRDPAPPEPWAAFTGPCRTGRANHSIAFIGDRDHSSAQVHDRSWGIPPQHPYLLSRWGGGHTGAAAPHASPLPFGRDSAAAAYPSTTTTTPARTGAGISL